MSDPESRLGAYLKNCRTRLDPAALGLTATRRRTPGLRREEVAQRANISATWYTWLEQGRGGAPSAVVLDRIADALMLTDVEREHVFLLGLGRPPEVRYRDGDAVSPRLQRVLDAFEYGPALVHTPLWDVVAWNRAAALLLTDYGELPPGERNIIKLVFLNARTRARQVDWEAVARSVVAIFRADAARAGSPPQVEAFVAEMRALSPEFDTFWRDHSVGSWGEGAKQLRHEGQVLSFDYSAFTVDGRPDLGMIVYTPSTPRDLDRVKALLAA
ncbi:helix-turn-helix protein [Pseudoduganella flava]|uniref:Helix-turn-helix domain-containing protein n=1 Tax=Pseudoduganella flava TaxID=871742 RepID=A0A562PSF2_9BURK|nr:helix-turn-helix transcriptional regulator [Pseudoduganella flava]QGZ39350.1 helix-turn-helix domain-containing protein [Pseudoduganella flava]TWI47339.1 helix-turn-helix protein [Pseudoduganella flava]